MISLVIDTDTGSDDAIALLMAAAHPQATIAAVTTVAGNVGLAQATQNAGRTLEVAGQTEIAFFVGCDRPLVRSLETAIDVHGSDGLGDTHQPVTTMVASSEHAAAALVRLASESPGEHTLVALGPLTNIAVALAIDPDLLTRFRSTVIMGGAPDMVGNTSDMAEFNIWVDPEAAARVFAAPGHRVMVGWNVATSAALVTPEQRQAMGELGTAAGVFARDVTAVVESFCHEQLGLPVFALPDPIAIAIALDPKIATRVETRGIRVGLSNDARGATFPTWVTDDLPVTDIVYEADAEAFAAQMMQALATLD